MKYLDEEEKMNLELDLFISNSRLHWQNWAWNSTLSNTKCLWPRPANHKEPVSLTSRS